MSFSKNAAPALLLLWCVAFAALLPASAEDWQPVTPEELKMTSEPNAPGAPAIFLYRQVDRDDQNSHEYYYARIKILTDEGRNYADVEIPYRKGENDIHKLEARTIRPDGTVINFDGKIFDKTIVRAGGQRIMAKTFTLPEVHPGTIIEYHYLQDIDAYHVYDVSWILSAELFTKHAKFSLKRYFEIPLAWSWPLGLPPGTDPPKEDHNVISLETQNVPAFQADEVKNWIPESAEVKLTNQPDWKSSSLTLEVEFDIKVPGWTTSAGRRQLVPVGLFSVLEKHMFEYAERVFPVYFVFPFLYQDDITVNLPTGLQVSGLPPAQDIGGKVVHYTLAAEGKNSTLHWSRHLSVDILLMQAKYYPGLQAFYQKVRTGDEQQIVLLPN